METAMPMLDKITIMMVKNVLIDCHLFSLIVTGSGG